MDTRKETLIAALRKFIAQRPGLEFGNYGNVSAYRSEMRSITKDRHHAETMLSAVAWRDSITADDIIKASEGAFSGRLSINTVPCRSDSQQLAYEARRACGGILEAPPPDSFKVTVSYCAGQYWPTEYRRAVCAVLSSALWDYWRECAGDIPHKGEAIRKTARAELSRSIAQRWFN